MTHITGIPTGTQPEPTDATIEHVVPVSYGGPSILWNLVLVCRYCNVARGNEREWCICPDCHEAWRRFAEDYMINVRRSRAAAQQLGWCWSVSEGKWKPEQTA